jgi:hypothetical protein
MVVLGVCMVAALAIAIAQTVSASPTAPNLTMSPDSNLHNGESVSVSVGPNGFFTPHAHVNILECADPGGKAANLPTDDTKCDGNTIQGPTILVATDGSFSMTGYSIYALPSATLGEQSNGLPVCNTTNPCVLFVGQNQNDFTAPKVFSAPFAIGAGAVTTTTVPSGTASQNSTPTSSPATSSTPTSGATGSTTTASSTPTSSSGTIPSTPLSTTGVGDPATLASTGPPAQLAWVVALGSVFMFVGSVGRRRVNRVRL